jgi:hypothetical protein
VREKRCVGNEIFAPLCVLGCISFVVEKGAYVRNSRVIGVYRVGTVEYSVSGKYGGGHVVG